MASTAAPGYFEEVKLGKCVHQVGGALASYPGRVGGLLPCGLGARLGLLSHSVVVVEHWRNYSNPSFSDFSSTLIINSQLYAVQSLVTAGFTLSFIFASYIKY